MRIAVSGWNRNMGETEIGNLSVEDLEIVDRDRFPLAHDYWGWEPDGFYDRNGVQIRWGKALKLTGDYKVYIGLSKEDVVNLFKKVIGAKLDNEAIRSCELQLDDSVIRQHLNGLKVEELLQFLQSPEEKGE